MNSREEMVRQQHSKFYFFCLFFVFSLLMPFQNIFTIHDGFSGREFGDRLIEDGMELPLNLQSNPSNLESLASLSSVASIQEQLPLDSTDPKDDGSAPPVPLQPRDEDGRGRTLSYGSVRSSLFHQKQ